MTVKEDTFARSVALLTADGPPRVWSLIVTLFGDLARGEGEELSGTLLTRLLGMAEIRPEAMRVALHRLRRDGWIESRRTGREGFYMLTQSGRAQSVDASPVIYQSAPDAPRAWHVLIAVSPEGQGVLSRLSAVSGYAPLGTAALLGPGPLPGSERGLVAVDAAAFRAPDAVIGEMVPPELRENVAELRRNVSKVAAVLDPAGLSPLKTAALRMLTVHCWRRVALRLPSLPAELWPDGWEGEACRAEVHGVLERLPRSPLSVLEAAARAPRRT